MPLKYLDDPGYALGMIRDAPSWRLPPGAVYDASNVVWDKPGIARQRMGTTALVSGAQTAFCTSLGFVYSQDGTPIEELYGLDGKTNAVYVINKTTGASTNIGSSSATNHTVGRPVRHFGFLIFPSSPPSGSTVRQATSVAGTTVSTTFTSTATAAVAAGNQQITLSGADVTTNVKVGSIVSAQDGGTYLYYGRVISVDTTKLFTVWPTPTVTFTAVAAGLFTVAAKATTGGACATSFQNRLLLGNTNDPYSSGGTLVTDRRVRYSVLPTETGTFVAFTVTGASFIETLSYPTLNYFEVPGADPIVAMEPVSDNQLLILTATHPVVFSGNLTTQLATTSPTITFDLSDINVNAGCTSDLSVQRTPKGVVWAGYGDIYAWDGRQPVSLTDQTINTYWRGLVRGSSFAVHGSAYVRGYYLISGTSGGSTFALMADLTGKTPRWTRASGAGTDIFFGVARPTDPSQVFAARWWAQSGAAPSMTNGQTVRLESMLNPYTAGTTTTDSDGTAVPVSVTTRVIGGDLETQKLFQRGTVRHQQSSTTAAMSVTAQSKIDAADIDASSVRTLGSLSNTSTLTITNATNANPIVVTTSAAHGLQSDDFVDIDAVAGNLNANGRWRIAVINTTSFSLVGGIGSAAYTSGGKSKKLTETDYALGSLNSGQGASLTITGSPNNFELHGVRLAVLEKPPVMSA